MPPDFLMQQMAWREGARRGRDGDGGRSARRRRRRAPARRATPSSRRSIDDAGDFAAAARQVRALMFVERFAADVDDRLAALEA